MSTLWAVVIVDAAGQDHVVQVYAQSKAEAIERGRVQWRDERGITDDDPRDDGFRMADAIELRR
jgi:hypothetical protein